MSKAVRKQFKPYLDKVTHIRELSTTATSRYNATVDVSSNLFEPVAV